MEKLFDELSIPEERVARLYASGKEKKEIAQILYKAVSTISNQLQAVFLKLDLKNGRELAVLVSERITKQNIKNAITALCFLSIISLHGLVENQRRPAIRRIRITQLSACRKRIGAEYSLII